MYVCMYVYMCVSVYYCCYCVVDCPLSPVAGNGKYVNRLHTNSLGIIRESHISMHLLIIIRNICIVIYNLPCMFYTVLCIYPHCMLWIWHMHLIKLSYRVLTHAQEKAFPLLELHLVKMSDSWPISIGVLGRSGMAPPFVFDLL